MSTATPSSGTIRQMGQDGRQGLQRLDLLPHHFPDLRGLRGRLARQLDRGALQFGAGLLEPLLTYPTDLGRHVLHVSGGAAEALYCLTEEAPPMSRASRQHRSLFESGDRLFAFPARGGPELVEMVADRAGGVLWTSRPGRSQARGRGCRHCAGLRRPGSRSVPWWLRVRRLCRRCSMRGYRAPHVAVPICRSTSSCVTAEVSGGVCKPTMVLFQGAGDRVGIAERRSGGLMHRIDLLADLVDPPCRNPPHARSAPLRPSGGLRPAVSTSPTRAWLETSRPADEACKPVKQLAAGARKLRERALGSPYRAPCGAPSLD